MLNRCVFPVQCSIYDGLDACPICPPVGPATQADWLWTNSIEPLVELILLCSRSMLKIVRIPAIPGEALLEVVVVVLMYGVHYDARCAAV